MADDAMTFRICTLPPLHVYIWLPARRDETESRNHELCDCKLQLDAAPVQARKWHSGRLAALTKPQAAPVNIRTRSGRSSSSRGICFSTRLCNCTNEIRSVASSSMASSWHARAGAAQARWARLWRSPPRRRCHENSTSLAAQRGVCQ
jgi:hypothetical protein